MKDYAVYSNHFLRELCIKNNWFTCGTCEQYEKFFELNENEASLETLATVNWLCSDEDLWDIEHIHIILRLERRKFLNRMNGYSE